MNGNGLQTRLAQEGPWPAWVALLFFLIAAVWIVSWAIRERRLNSVQAALLAGLRLAAVAMLVLMALGLTLRRFETAMPDLVVAVDVSESMARVDAVDEETEAARFRRLRSAGLEESRRLDLARLPFLLNNGALLDQLDRRYHLRLFTLGTSGQAVSGESDCEHALRSLSAEDDETRLGESLRDIVQLQRGRATAAIVLVTDGITTEGEALSEAAALARARNIPLFVVGVGQGAAARDLRVHSLVAESQVFAGDLVHFDFQLSARGFADETVTVQLFGPGGELLDDSEVTLSSDEVAQAVRLSTRIAADGDGIYEVRVPVRPREGDVENNVVRHELTVREQPIRVLLVDRAPRYEFRFLKLLLERTVRGEPAELVQGVELDVVLQDSDANWDPAARNVMPVTLDEWLAYDVVVLGDVDPGRWAVPQQELLVDYVTQEGRGVVVVSGERFMPLAYANAPLADLLPIDVTVAVEAADPAERVGGFAMEVTPLGLAAPPMQLEDQVDETALVWGQLPQPRWMIEAPRVMPAAQVWLRHADRSGPDGRGFPLICSQFVGAGQVVFHAMDESYLWSGFQEDDRYYQRYWIQTLRQLARNRFNDAEGGVELVVQPPLVPRGERVPIIVRFRTPQSAALAADQGVTADVEMVGGGLQRTVTLERVAGRADEYRGEVRELPAGNYRATVSTPWIESAPDARFEVTNASGEQSRLEPDLAEMRQTARISGGKYYRWHRAGALLEDLPEGRQIPVAALPPWPLWNAPWTAGVFILLLAADWALRRRWGLP